MCSFIPYCVVEIYIFLADWKSNFFVLNTNKVSLSFITSVEEYKPNQEFRLDCVYLGMNLMSFIDHTTPYNMDYIE